MNRSTIILNAIQIKQRIDRIAYQIYEDSSNEQEIIIAGISNGGYKLALLLNEALKAICPIPTRLIEITLEKEKPTNFQLNPAASISEFKDKTIIHFDHGITGIVGPNGCGKSTLANLVPRFFDPIAGRVLLDGADITGASGNVGYMLQKDLLVPWRSVVDNITLGAALTRVVRGDGFFG